MGSRTIGVVGRMLRVAAYQQAIGAEVRVLGAINVTAAARDPQFATAEVIAVEHEGGKLAGVQPLRTAFANTTLIAIATSGIVLGEAEVRAAGYDRVVAARTPEDLAVALRTIGRRTGLVAAVPAAPAATVLIVEDDAALGGRGEQLLEDEGYRVLVAESGPAALAILERETPDLILLDVVMPGMDGREVCRRVRAKTETREVPVIFVSALDVLGDQL